MTRKHLKRLYPLLALAIFLIAVWTLYRILGEYRLEDIVTQLRDFPPRRLAAAASLTALTYLVLTFYDHLALAYLGRSLPVGKITLASFTTYAFSRNIGFSVLTGGSVRYRYYSSWGLPAGEIGRLIAFAALGFTLGMTTMGGAILLLSPGTLPDLPRVPLDYLRPIGALLLTLVAGYLLLTFRRVPASVRLRGWRIPLPSPRHALGQVAVGAADWTLTASVLYSLLPPAADLSLPHFLQIYLFAQIAVIVSHVPGGLGVFESVVLLLAPDLSAPALFGALLMYRGIFFLAPFVLAILLFGAFEVRHRQKRRRA